MLHLSKMDTPVSVKRSELDVSRSRSRSVLPTNTSPRITTVSKPKEVSPPASFTPQSGGLVNRSTAGSNQLFKLLQQQKELQKRNERIEEVLKQLQVTQE